MSKSGEWPGSEPEISRAEQRIVVGRAREMAPYRGQAIDKLGSFATHFAHLTGDGFTSIYIPGLSGVQIEGQTVSDLVQIVDRTPTVLDDEVGMTIVTSYGIHETTGKTEYTSEARVFDMKTKKEIRPPETEEEREQRTHEARAKNTERITFARLMTLTALLDSLDPTQTIERPEASS